MTYSFAEVFDLFGHVLISLTKHWVERLVYSTKGLTLGKDRTSCDVDHSHQRVFFSSSVCIHRVHTKDRLGSFLQH
jgi:hypothetical protein